MSEQDPFEAAADEEFERARKHATQHPPADPSPTLGRAGAEPTALEPVVRHEAHTPIASRPADEPDIYARGDNPFAADPDGQRFREGEFSNEPGWLEPGPRNAQLCYWLNLGGMVITPLPLVAAAMALFNRRKVGAGLATHYTYVMRTVVLVVLYGLLASATGRYAGFALLGVVIWYVWRNLRGLAGVGSGAPIANPRSWLV